MLESNAPELADYTAPSENVESRRRNNIIAFGKYKGQPVEVLQTDPSYCEWLQGQNWFVERYPQINTLIINNFTQAEDTPVHNALQARFLDESLIQKLCEHVLTVKNPDYLKIIREAYLNRHRKCTEQKANNKEALCGCWKEPDDTCYCIAAAKSDGKIIINKTEFEENGWDVRINAVLPYGNAEKSEDLEIKISVEIKPAVGDDYPSILRQIKSNMCGSKSFYVLIYNEFTANGVTLDQVTRIFKQSGIDMVSYAELDRKRIEGLAE